MQSDYFIASRSTSNKVTLTYQVGRFEALRIEGDWTEAQLTTLLRRVPLVEAQLAEVFGKDPNVRLYAAPQDLSFKAFYNAYRYKVGKKVVAENTWERLSKKDRTLALAGVEAYENYLRRHQGIAKAYPSTYLNQRYWENHWNSA